MGSLPRHVGVGMGEEMQSWGECSGGGNWCLGCHSLPLYSLLPFWSKLGSAAVCYLTFLSFTCKQDNRTC